MIEKIHKTPLGNIHYWINLIDKNNVTLVFLPGLTADHRLFDKQIEFFENKYNVFVWDAPAHASSWPFKFDFDLISICSLKKLYLKSSSITFVIKSSTLDFMYSFFSSGTASDK